MEHLSGMLRTGALAAFALLTSLLFTPGSTVSAQQSSLDWRSCGSYECATLRVPLDYTNPSGNQIDLALVRKPAADKSKRIGSLLVNPGGPGGSGVDFVRAWTPVLSSSIRDRFDIVGWDPRGVGQSTPLVCHPIIKEYIAADPSPDSQEEWNALESVTRSFAKDCANAAGSDLDFYGTKNVARDLDRIRGALGDDKLTYLGYSYGTVIGQAYLQLFPDRVRAMVLDGAVDLSLNVDGITIAQAVGFERALANFVQDCRDRANRCDLNDHGDPADAIQEVLARAEEAPIPSKSADRPAGPGETLLGIIAPLYNQVLWSRLDNAVSDALDGDGSALVKLTDGYLERRGNDYSNSLEMNLAVNCVDNAPSKLPTNYQDYIAVEPMLEQQSPTFGRAFGNGLACALWKARPDPLSPPTDVRDVPPVVVVSTTGDPATPYDWGVSVSEQIEDAVLLTYRGEGHTAYAGGDDCVDDAVNAYLIDTEAPGPGTICGDGPDVPGSQASPTRTPEDDAVVSDEKDDAPRPAGRAWQAFGIVVMAAFVFTLAGSLALSRKP